MPRLNKRQLRELEEVQQLEAANAAAGDLRDDADAEEESDDHDSAVEPARSSFAALVVGGDAEEEEDDEIDLAEIKPKKSKSKKKKKKPPVLDSAPATPLPSTKSHPKGGSSKVPVIDGGMDEIDRALAELGMDKPRIIANEATRESDPIWEAVRDLFVIDPKNLDSDAELRRFFGAKVINKTPIAAVRSGHHARFANNPHHSTSIRRTASYLANPEPGWAPLASNGLTLSRFTDAESKDEKGDWYTYEHSVDYRRSQLQFLQVVQQHADGNRLFDVLERNPYSVDTLLQLSEMSGQQGDLGAASTYLSKALYALSGPLPASFLAGGFRLPYTRVENRCFYLAVARKVALLVKRGSNRTGNEWAKIALGASGAGDHVGMLLYIDFLAPKSKQDTWFLSFLDKLPKSYPSLRLESYPGLAYAKALCLRNLEEDKSENDEKSTAALRSAILRFPMVVSLLYASLGGDVPPQIVSNRRAQIDGRYTDKPTYLLSLLSEVYVIRSSPLWKQPDTLAWLHKTAKAAAASMDDSSLLDVRIGEKLFLEGPWEQGYSPAGIIRAAFISDIPSIRPYLPPAALSGTSYSYDPIPPVAGGNTTFFDNDYFLPIYSERARRPTRAQQQANRDNQAKEIRRLNEGIAQLEQLLNTVDLTTELREQLMRELDQARIAAAELEEGGRQIEIPGGWNDEDEEDYEEEEDEDGQDQEGVLNRLMGMFRR